VIAQKFADVRQGNEMTEAPSFSSYLNDLFRIDEDHLPLEDAEELLIETIWQITDDIFATAGRKLIKHKAVG
jgi:hypothetical protein